MRDETLAAWIERNVSFPNAMVDRITPGSDEDLKALVARRFGVVDKSPVATEPFAQWVVEDTFADGRPPLDRVGVQFVTDVSPYKLVKSRLLNGTHSAMAYLGHLAGHATTADMMEDPDMRAFVTQLMQQEIAPLLPRVPGMDLDGYVGTLLDRLANPEVGDPLTRLCGRGSTKVPAYLLPSLVESRRRGRPAPLLTLAVAAWFRYLRGTDRDGAPITIKDARLEELQPLALRGRSDPSALLGCRDVLGTIADDLTIRRGLHAALVDLEHDLRYAVTQRLAADRAHVITLRPYDTRTSSRGSDLIS
jgi:mannitol 2-dehydrogenase